MTFMPTTVFYERNETRTLHGGHVVDVEAKLYSLGNQAPYFSITASEWRSKRRYDGDIECCGQMHERIAELFPHLQPIIDVHLSTEDGRPMHAVANTLYWCGMSGMSPRSEYSTYPVEVDDIDGREWAPTILAAHLRVPIDEARHIRREIALVRLNTWNPVVGTKRDFTPHMGEILAEHDMPARWQADADRALALMTKVRDTVHTP